jgi:hypothetical protein
MASMKAGTHFENEDNGNVSTNSVTLTRHAVPAAWKGSSSLPYTMVSCFSWADLSDSESDDENQTSRPGADLSKGVSIIEESKSMDDQVANALNKTVYDDLSIQLSPLTSGTPTASSNWLRSLEARSALNLIHESCLGHSSTTEVKANVSKFPENGDRSDLYSSVCESFDLFGYASRSCARSAPGKVASSRNCAKASQGTIEAADAEIALLPLRGENPTEMGAQQGHKLWQSSRALLESTRRHGCHRNDYNERSSDQGFSLYAAVAERVELEEVIDAAERASKAITNGGARLERPYRSGASGAYLIRNATGTQSVLGIFKPFDEETAGTELPLQPARMYFHPAEGAFKECAAYLLDHGHFANIPQTALAKCELVDNCGDTMTRKTKCGAFQVYYRNRGDAEDFGPGVFDTESVQRIAAFDIRVLQCDRNASNVLVCDTSELLRHRGLLKDSESCEKECKQASQRTQMQLVAIDHAYILPEQVPTVPRACWMDWTQSQEAVLDSVRRYVLGLDSFADVKLLTRELGPRALRKGSLRSLCVGTLLLKLGIQAGLTLYQIGLLVYGDASSTRSAESWQSTRAARSHRTQDSSPEDYGRAEQSRFEGRSKLETAVLEAERVCAARDKRLQSLFCERPTKPVGSLYVPLVDDDYGVFAFEEQLQAAIATSTSSGPITVSTAIAGPEQQHQEHQQPRNTSADAETPSNKTQGMFHCFDDAEADLVPICALESPFFCKYLSKRLTIEIERLKQSAPGTNSVAESGSVQSLMDMIAARRSMSPEAPVAKTSAPASGSSHPKHSGIRRCSSEPNLQIP